METEKMCRRCKGTFLISHFYSDKTSRDKLCAYCKPCHKAKALKYYYATPLEIRQQGQRQKNLKGHYGLSLEDFSVMLGEQMNLCAACKVPMTMIPRQPNTCCIDHDHTKKKGEKGFIRGLLCLWCNTGLGYFKDSPKLIRQAAIYLEKANAVE